MITNKLLKSNSNSIKSICESLQYDDILSLRISYNSFNDREKITKFEIIANAEIPNDYKNYIFSHWDIADITFDVIHNLYPDWSSHNGAGTILITSTGNLIIEHSDKKHGSLVGDTFTFDIETIESSMRF